MCVHACVRLCVCVCVRAYVCACVFACMCACLCECVLHICENYGNINLPFGKKLFHYTLNYSIRHSEPTFNNDDLLK